MATYYKIFTHDYCSPLQGGKPVWDGSMPFKLPEISLDASETECAAGWNFVDDLAKGFKIARMWPTGRPSDRAEQGLYSARRHGTPTQTAWR